MMFVNFKSVEHSARLLLSQHPEIINELAKRISLRYKPDIDSAGNVCFIESEEVRPEFKDSFSFTDVVNCLVGQAYARQKDVSEKELFGDFPFPNSAEEFWKHVKSGSTLRKIDRK